MEEACILYNDILLADIWMPDMDRNVLLGLLCAFNIRRAMAILIMSIITGVELKDEFFSQNFTVCVRKPF